MKCATAICLFGLVCIGSGCFKRNDGPDISEYTSKLAGVRIWKVSSLYYSGGTRIWPDDTAEIVVNDDEHITMFGGTLTYDKITDSLVVYTEKPDVPKSDLRLYFCYKQDSLSYTMYYASNLCWSITTYTSHL